ncbi:MAG: VWA-like domain-containing protein [Myxococcota bacterium]
MARMDPVAHDRVPVMAVTLRQFTNPRSRIVLLVNRPYFATHPDWFAGVLLHELQHVVLGHLTHQPFHAVQHPRLMEIAMEVSANEGIGEALPPYPITVERLARFGLAPGQSTLDRYRLLVEAQRSGRLQVEKSAGWQAGLWDLHRPRDLGLPHPGLGDLIDREATHHADRGQWLRGLGPPSPHSILAEMKQAIAQHLGGEPGGLDDPAEGGIRRPGTRERVVLATATGPTVNWGSVLKQALSAQRRVQPDYRRPNRRFRNRMGEIPGRSRRPPKPRLLVAIDTSASMHGTTLDRVATELRALAPHAQLIVVEVDAAIQRIGPLRSNLGTFLGGGDTNFSPAFAETDTRDVDGLVYFTDGQGDLPSRRPDVPTVWAIPHDGPFEPGFGLIVRLGWS